MIARIPTALGGAALAAALPFVSLAVLLPQAFSIRVPLLYSGDGLSHGLLVKSVLEEGWFPTHNPRLGAPFGAAWFDYPNADAANLALLKIIGMFSSDWIVAANMFYLATFAAASVASFVVLRQLGVRLIFALVGALLFAELPYHFLRSGHLLLVAYWSVPIGVYLALICGPQANARGEREPGTGLWSRVLMAVAVACGGIYYAFFTIVLVCAAGFANGLAERRWRASLPALGVAAIIVATVMVEVIPTFGYWYTNGTNKQVAKRAPAEAEHYAFKPIQLFLPHQAHRLPLARQIADAYARSSPLVNENATASLGVVGAVGLAMILAYALCRIVVERRFDPPLETLAWQAIVAFAFGTAGGAGSVLAHAGFTSIRAYNRISVFLGFIGIAAAFLFLQRGLPRILLDKRICAGAAAAAALVIGAMGTLDQLPLSMHGQSPEFQSDRQFFAALERRLPSGTAVYQLPYHPYPEGGPVNRMDDYSLARGYLHTNALRWSYGAIKGRAEDAWLRSLAEHDIGEQLDLASKSGFGAVYVDRRGYPDDGKALEMVLRSKLGDPIVARDDGNLVAYSLRPTGMVPLPLADVLPKWETPIQFNRETLSPRIAGLTGFSLAESTGRWTNDTIARLEFLTPLPQRFRLRIETLSAMPPSANVDLPIDIDGVRRTVRVGNSPTVVEASFDLPSEGCHVIEIRIPNPVSPRDVGLGPDTRRLGIHVRSIAILPDER